MTDSPIEFFDFPEPPMTEERQKSIEFVVSHWRTNSTDTGLEWVPCGPDCTHQPGGDE
jgi:hypothetical protein